MASIFVDTAEMKGSVRLFDVDEKVLKIGVISTVAYAVKFMETYSGCSTVLRLAKII